MIFFFFQVQDHSAEDPTLLTIKGFDFCAIGFCIQWETLNWSFFTDFDSSARAQTYSHKTEYVRKLSMCAHAQSRKKGPLCLLLLLASQKSLIPCRFILKPLPHPLPK